jgi:hypothetical protein
LADINLNEVNANLFGYDVWVILSSGFPEDILFKKIGEN